MFREHGSHSMSESERLALRLCSNDLSGVHMTGDHTDRIFKHGSLVEEREGHNLVVTSFLRLVMCMLKRQEGYTGIQYWAVGSGIDTWDADIPTPDIDATRLTLETGRAPILPEDMTFLDEDFNPVDTPTNIIQIKHLFREGDCNGVWREFGLFGGNATEAPNSGIIVNKRHHAILTKTEEMTVERIMRFTLSLV